MNLECEICLDFQVISKIFKQTFRFLSLRPAGSIPANLSGDMGHRSRNPCGKSLESYLLGNVRVIETRLINGAFTRKLGNCARARKIFLVIYFLVVLLEASARDSWLNSWHASHRLPQPQRSSWKERMGLHAAVAVHGILPSIHERLTEFTGFIASSLRI